MTNLSILPLAISKMFRVKSQPIQPWQEGKQLSKRRKNSSSRACSSSTCTAGGEP